MLYFLDFPNPPSGTPPPRGATSPPDGGTARGAGKSSEKHRVPIHDPSRAFAFPGPVGTPQNLTIPQKAESSVTGDEVTGDKGKP